MSFFNFISCLISRSRKKSLGSKNLGQIRKNETLRQSDAVALGIEVAADLLESAVALRLVLDGGRLHEEGVTPVLSKNLVEAFLELEKRPFLKKIFSGTSSSVTNIGLRAVAQLVEHPSKVPVWCNSTVGSNHSAA